MLSWKRIKLMAVITLSLAIGSSSGALAANVTSKSAVNVRSGPGMKYSVVTVMDKGTQASDLGSSKGWTKVSVNGKTGYVASDYLTQSSQKQKKAAASSSAKTVKITASSLNVRSGAGTNSSVIGGLSKGTTVTVTGTSGTWYKIKYGSGYGYINSKYTTAATSSVSASEKGASSSSTKYCTASSLNIRSGAGTSYSVVGNLTKGRAVTVVSTSNGWSKIKNGNGYGYVSAKYLSSSKPASTNSSATSSNSSSLISYAKSFIGCKYVYGATGPSTFDCSGLTQYVFKHFGISIPRTSAEQYSQSTKVSKSNLKTGDLVFFSNSSSNGKVSHVGIYIGNNQMIHAANDKDNVCISNINSNYYQKYFIGCGRY